MIRSAMNLNMSSDLDFIGASKARSYRQNGKLTAVVECGKVAIVQGYYIGSTIADCLPTCIKVRDLSGIAKACYGDLQDF